MKIGTKSLLFGCHQVIWHPFTVALAYRKLFKRWPDLYGSIAIFVHDWGYWGKSDIDGEDGKTHPMLGAIITGKLTYYIERLRGRNRFCASLVALEQSDRCVLHGRTVAKENNLPPSDLCWADKYSLFCDPEWFYLLRTRLSGEIKEFRLNAVKSGHVPATSTDRTWLHWFKNYTLAHAAILNLLQRNSAFRNQILLRNRIACSTHMHNAKTLTEYRARLNADGAGN